MISDVSTENRRPLIWSPCLKGSVKPTYPLSVCPSIQSGKAESLNTNVYDQCPHAALQTYPPSYRLQQHTSQIHLQCQTSINPSQSETSSVKPSASLPSTHPPLFIKLAGSRSQEMLFVPSKKNPPRKSLQPKTQTHESRTKAVQFHQKHPRPWR